MESLLAGRGEVRERREDTEQISVQESGRKISSQPTVLILSIRVWGVGTTSMQGLIGWVV